MKSVPISDFQKNAPEYVQSVSNAGHPVSIAIDGKPAVVLVGIEMYEKMAAQTQIFKILLQGERDIDSGVGYSMEKVMQDATEIEKEWATEADRRQQAVERGESRVLPLESVMREILSGLAQDANAGLESIAAKPSAFDVDGVKTQATMEDISQAIAESRTSNHRDRD